MRKLLYPVAILALILTLTSSCGEKPVPDVPDPVVPAGTFVKGADISWVTEMESKGYKFYNSAGQERECTELLKELGANAVRLRVWVNPTGGWNGRDDVVVKARRAQALGMKVMIDFHYSDSWADPGKQNVPAAWKSMDAAAMAAAVGSHTREVLRALKDAGVDVAWVQVGNEVTNGMLWNSGKVAGTSVGEFVNYFRAGHDAVKEVYPDAQVILHLDNGWKLDTLNWFLLLMQSRSLPYDILGLSLYPSYWENGAYPDWTPKVRQFVENVPVLVQSYGKPVMLVEFGMPSSEPAKAAAALQYIIDNTADDDSFLGIFYWEPESERDRNGYDYGAFSGGKPTAALGPFAK